MCERNHQEDWERRVEERVFEQLDLTQEIADKEILYLIDEALKEFGTGQYVSLSQKMKIRQSVFNEMRGLGVLTPLLEDDSITEIMVNGYDHIFVERNGCLEKTGAKFRSVERYRTVLQQIVSECNRTVNESSPIVDARLKNGSRVNIVLDPISLDGAALTIRKFPKEAITIERLITLDSLSKEVAEELRLLVMAGYNILISGGTGSGKTTFLNALSNYIPKEERIITIEDSAELQLKQVNNLIRLEVRNANVEGKNAITIRDLIKSSLRMRPDRVIVGEVRGAEALDMIQALSTGHDGSISTLHANTARDAISRLEMMVMMATDIPLPALRRQISSAIEIIIHLGRLRDHSRRVLEIIEVLDLQDGEIGYQTLYAFEEDNREGKGYDMGQEIRDDRELHRDSQMHLRVQGQLVRQHHLKQVQKLVEAGYYETFCGMTQSNLKQDKQLQQTVKEPRK